MTKVADDWVCEVCRDRYRTACPKHRGCPLSEHPDRERIIRRAFRETFGKDPPP